MNGPQWVSGISGMALSFDGSDDYVSIPDSSSLDISGNQISIEFWMNSAVDLPHPTTPEEATYFFDKGNAYVGSIQMDVGNPTYYGRLTFSLPFSTPDNKYIRSTKDSWNANTWFHIALTYDGNIMRIYVNGALDNSVEAGGNVHTSSYPLAIGSYCDGPHNFFNGTIDEFAIYNYARTAEEILRDYVIVDWIKYFGNPLNLGTNVGGPMVILDGATYKMWYCSGGDICYATSYDGVSWHNHGRVLNGSDNSWEPVLSRASVVLDEGTYEMWYTGYSPSEQFGRIGYANSSDGISWTKYEGNPVLTPGGNGGWDDWNVFSPTVVKDGSTYKMWYVAQDSQYSPLRIGYANSSDGISWTKYEGNPVLTPGGNGGWDDTHVSQPFVMKDGDRYDMWYVGSLPDAAKIGLATSNDGVSWTKYAGNPLLTTGDGGLWESRSVVLGSIVFDGITYKMWYEGQTGIESRIGLAYYPATLSSYDPIDDLYYYESGSHAPTWPVIDIVYTEVSLVNDTHIRLLTRTSEYIPSSNQWQGYYWLLDTGVATRPYWNPHDSNDLNVSYTVGVCWGADGSLHVTVGNNTDGTTVFYEDARDHPEKYFNNDTCFITIPLSWIGDPESIRWVAGSTDGVSGGRHDKAPNMTKVGDLGGGVPPAFFDCDGSVDGKDLALFLQCYRGTAPAEAMYLGDLGGGVPPQFYDCDGNVDGKDLSLFLQCYKGLGP
jgi:hypothetical protein